MVFLKLSNDAAERPSVAADAIQAAALTLCNAVALKLGESATRPLVQAAAVAAIRAALPVSGIAKGVGAANDARLRQWHVKAEIWTADNGRELDRLEWQGETTALGLDGVAERLRDAAAFVFTRGRWDGLPDAMRAHVLADKLSNMRPALSRNGGRANMRYRFDTGRDGAVGESAFLHATITRADVAERIAAETERAELEHGATAAANDAAVAAIRRSGALPYGPGVDVE